MVENVGSKQGQNVAIILIVLAVIVIAFLILNKTFKGSNALLETLGLKDDADEKATDDVLTRNKNKAENAGYWTPSLYKSKAGCKLVTRAVAERLAGEIYDSVGYFYDTPAQAVAAFKQLKYKSQISFLTDVFSQKYKLDLKTFLNERFDTTEQKKALNDIYNYTEKLPNGY